MVLIIYKLKEIKYKQGRYVYIIQHSSPIKVFGCIICCLYLGKELAEAFMVEPVNQPYAAQ